MSEKLKDYQVLDVFCSGTFYKVRHKVTNNIFAWKASNCCAHTDEQIQNVVNEVKTISKVESDILLRYYDTILHGPTKTLYFVVEYVAWRSLDDLLEECKVTEKHFAESFIWLALHELARAARAAAALRAFRALRQCITPTSVFVSENGEFRVNCFNWPSAGCTDLMQQVGDLVHTLCYLPWASDDKIKDFHYSEDLQDVVSFLTESRSAVLRPDVVLYHPTVLSNMETLSQPKSMSDILISTESLFFKTNLLNSELNKCDSEKAGEICRPIRPMPRMIFNVTESPIYGNITPKRNINSEAINSVLGQDSLSPTLAALALELPGFVPRSRKPYSNALERYSRPQLVSEETFSQEWMSRLVALRRREESLNQRERDLITKEIVNSPHVKVIPLNDSRDLLDSDSNGITLPPEIRQAPGERREWSSRRRRRRPGSVRSRGRRKSYGYEELDSSLSADAGDTSLVITAAKFTEDNMPRRNIFPEVSTKKVHFTATNPFMESDDSVTLTYYELGSVDKDGYQVPKLNLQKGKKDINQFKYLNLEKMSNEKRSAMNWSHSSPSKQAKICKSVFSDISNQSSIRKTPSKSSLSSNSSRLSMMSAKSHWSMESSISKVSDSTVFERTRSQRQSLANTPVAPPDVKKKSRKSLIPFKTPFKFMSSTKS